MPVDYSKFDHIGDSDEEEAPRRPPSAPGPQASGGKAAEALAAAATGPARMLEEHSRPLDAAPELGMGSEEWMSYYRDEMTAPQRMQTMVHFWNSSTQEERVEFLRHLIDIIGNPAISNKIKGGQEILKDLDTSFYHGVTYPEKWVKGFNEGPLEEKKAIFEKCFTSLDTAERGLVIGTLM